MIPQRRCIGFRTASDAHSIVKELSRYSNPHTGLEGMAHTVINAGLRRLGRPDSVPKEIWDNKNDDKTRRAAVLLTTVRSMRQRGLAIGLTEPEQEYLKEQINSASTRQTHEFWSNSSDDLASVQTLDVTPPTIPERWLGRVKQPLTLMRAASWMASAKMTASDAEMAAFSLRRNLHFLRSGSSLDMAEMVSLMSEPLAERFCNETFDPEPDSPIKKRAERAFKKYLTEVVPLLQQAQRGEMDQSLFEKANSAFTSAILSVDQDED